MTRNVIERLAYHVLKVPESKIELYLDGKLGDVRELFVNIQGTEKIDVIDNTEPSLEKLLSMLKQCDI